MKILKLAAIIGTLCADGALPQDAQVQEPVINIGSMTKEIAPRIVLRSRFDFEQSISLQVKIYAKLLPTDVLVKTISKIGMTDAKGIRITSGFDIDLNNKVVVAFSGGTSQIIKAYQTAKGLQLVTSFKDKNGNLISPPAHSLAVYGIDGNKLCFEYKDVTRGAPKMAFTLLLDHSGSMVDVISDVRKSAHEFLNALPATAECAVASFNEPFSYHNQIYQNCNAGNFHLSGITAGGGTDLYHPLLSAYASMDQDYFKDHQKAVIIITDGQIWPDAALRQEIQAAKKDTLTFVYFSGSEGRPLSKRISRRLSAKHLGYYPKSHAVFSVPEYRLPPPKSLKRTKL